MKKTLILIIIIILLSSTLSMAEKVNLSSGHYILMDESSGRVLVEKGANTKMPMASTTKIMTALIALERGNPNDIVEIVGEKVNVEGSSIYLKHGEKIKLIDLIYGLMLRSGNDAALAIANHISGSEEAFVKLMNERAKEIGASNTNFTNPHGLHNKDHYSTAYDLALITKYAFSVNGFAQVSGSKSYKSDRVQDSLFINKNKGVYEYQGGDGVKIGYTTSSGRCLVSSASRDGMRLIAVTLNDGNWFHNNYALMDYGFANYKPYVIYNKGQLIHRQSINNGKKDIVALVSQDELVLPLNEEEKLKVKLAIKDTKRTIKAPIVKGDILGSLEVYLDGVLVKTDNLIAKSDIEKKNFFDKLNDMLKININ